MKSGGSEQADGQQPKLDFGTPELRQKILFSIERVSQKGGKRIRVYSHPLDFYFRKRQHGKPLISERQKDAGDRLWKDFELGCYLRYGVASYSRVRVDGSARDCDGLGASQEAARVRFSKAMKHLNDDVSIKMAIYVCCFGEFVKDLETEYSKNSNSRMDRLREVLDRLGDFYGIPRYLYI